MGFLDGDTIVVDAILTKHGRALLSRGVAVNPTHFALSDDGVDYTLWNSKNISGSDNYGDYITKMPNLEAVPDDAVQMRYTLYTLPQNTRYLPAVSINQAPNAEHEYTLDNNQVTKEEIVLAPTVTNYAKEGSVLYDFTFYDPTGIKFIDLGGGQMRKITGHEHKAQELKSPVTVVIEGSTGVTVTDKTVVSDVECFVLIQETTTGATTTAKLKTIKA